MVKVPTKGKSSPGKSKKRLKVPAASRPLGRRPRGETKSRDGVKASASTAAMSVHVKFAEMWTRLDISDKKEAIPSLAALKKAMPAAARGSGRRDLSQEMKVALNRFRAESSAKIEEDTEKFLKLFVRESSEKNEKPLALPLSLVERGGAKSGIGRFHIAKPSLKDWVYAFALCNLVYDQVCGLGLVARKEVAAGKVVAQGFRDEQAPTTEWIDEKGNSILGPLLYINPGCPTHVNVRLSNRKPHMIATACKPISRGSLILTSCAPPEGVVWTCAHPNCSETL